MAEKSVKIKVIKPCYVGGTVRKAGEVLTVSEDLARELSWMKKAEPFNPEPALPPSPKTSEPVKEIKVKIEEKKGGNEK